ncbi:MAG: hypothetical protein COB51_03590 [Moraxellaceae bacterium]|nr:MAG: hypothetical protein COB51_03590 [Moraxellaceae bacterium]
MNLKFRYARKIMVASTLAFFLSGCAVTSVFMPYPKQASTIKQQIEAKQIQLATDKLDKKRHGADKILYLMERGRTAQIGNESKISREDYLHAKEAISALEQKAVINASSAGSKAASLFTNDNAIPYVGESYEHVFLYHFQAMNYLFDNDLQGALVEVRRANEEQQLALRRHAKELDKLAKKKQKQQQPANQKKSFMSAFSQLNSVSDRVKNSFQNAYTFYASGVMWELEGKDNDAYIDYKKALEIFPDNPYLQVDVIRLAKSLGMREDLARFKKQFKAKDVPPVSNGGELIVFYEQGFAPVKEEIKVSIPTHKGIHSVAFPTYSGKWKSTPALTIRDISNNQALGATSPIVYVQALATKALQEDLPGMLVRQVLRIVAKKEAADKAGEQLGTPGKIAATIFNIATERADLRSWLTLPNDAQIYRGVLAAGERNIRIGDGSASEVIAIKIVPGKKTILRVVGTGKTLHTRAITL